MKKEIRIHTREVRVVLVIRAIKAMKVIMMVYSRSDSMLRLVKMRAKSG